MDPVWFGNTNPSSPTSPHPPCSVTRAWECGDLLILVVCMSVLARVGQRVSLIDFCASSNSRGQSILRRRLWLGPGRENHLTLAAAHSVANFQSLKTFHKLFPLSTTICLQTFASLPPCIHVSAWRPSRCIPLVGHWRFLHPDPTSYFLWGTYLHLRVLYSLTCMFRVTSPLVLVFVT